MESIDLGKVFCNIRLLIGYKSGIKKYKLLNKMAVYDILFTENDFLSAASGDSFDVSLYITDADQETANKLIAAVERYPGLTPAYNLTTKMTRGTAVTPEGTVSLLMPVAIPQKLQKEDRSFYVLYIGNDGMVHCLYDLDADPTTVTFETDRYSYALAYCDEPGVQPAPVSPLLAPAPQPTPSPISAPERIASPSTQPEESETILGISNLGESGLVIILAGVAALILLATILIILRKKAK